MPDTYERRGKMLVRVPDPVPALEARVADLEAQVAAQAEALAAAGLPAPTAPLPGGA